MGSGSSTTTTSQKSDPWAEAQPYLKDIMAKGQSAYNTNAGGNLWSGPTLSAQSPETTRSLGMVMNTANMASPMAQLPAQAASGIIANQGLSSAMQPGLGTLGSMGSGKSNVGSYLDSLGGGGGVNPALQQMLDDNAARIGNRVATQMGGMGRYGSFDHGDALARSITAANAPIISSAYESDQGRRLQASQAADQTQMQATNSQLGFLGGGLDRVGQFSGMMPGLNDLMYDPAKRLAGVGAYSEGRSQAELDNERAQFERTQNMPWEQLGKYQNAISGLGGILGGTGTKTGTTTTPGQETPWTTYAGLGLSLLSLSDERLKKDIVKPPDVIDARTGAPTSFWRYAWEDASTPLKAGPMAQDVLKTRPEIVHNIGGLLAIEV